MLEFILKIMSSLLESPEVHEAIWPLIVIGAGLLLAGKVIIASISDLEDEIREKESEATFSFKVKRNLQSGNYNTCDIGLRDENEREFQEIDDLKISKSLGLKEGDVLYLTN